MQKVKTIAQKVKELELDEFVKLVLDSDEQVASQVQEANIDAEKIIARHKPNIDKYGTSTGVAFAVSRLKEAILEANSESVRGIMVGARDRFATNAPMRMPLLSSTGDHIELVNWGNQVKLGDSKVDVPFPCVANLKVLYDGEYRGVPNIRLISAEKFENLSVPDTTLRLGKVAKSVGELDGGDELKVVVVRGRISFVRAATKWKDKEKDGEWQLYLPNQHEPPVMHPIMQISLETENNNSVRTTFDRQRNAVPTVMVEDFMPLVQDAVKNSTEPGEQAKFFGECMRGRDVIVVGFMTKYTPAVDINYIDIGGYAIFDAKVGAQATLGKKTAKEEPADEASVDEDAGKPAQKAAAPKGAAKTAAKKPAGKQIGLTFDGLKDKVKSYCDTLGIKPSDLTPEKVQKELAPGKSQGFIVEVLNELKLEE